MNKTLDFCPQRACTAFLFEKKINVVRGYFRLGGQGRVFVVTCELLLEGRQNPCFLDGRGVFWDGGTAHTVGRPLGSVWFGMFKNRRGSDFVGLGRPAGDDEKPLVGGSWCSKKSK